MRHILFVLFAVILAIGCNGQSNSKIEYQKAFAKVYGYVKYFHPSDEASQIDWDNFAIYGARRIGECSSHNELLEALDALFKPLAPSIRFHLGEEIPAYDMEIVTPTSKNNYEVTYWQHKGVSLGMTNQGRPYSSVRVNRVNETDNSAPFGNIMASMDATEYQGKRFRYSGWVRLEDSTKGSGHLWFRVDNSDNSKGFFDNMGNTPITGVAWKQYQIEGLIDSSADKIVFGCFLQGKGKLLLDDVKLEYLDGGKWVSMPLGNGSFENNKLTEGGQWRHSGRGYDFGNTETDSYHGNRAAIIEHIGDGSKWRGKRLFGEHPKFGELIEESIGANLGCQIPVALYANDNGTFPKAPHKTFESLMSVIGNNSISGDDMWVRIGNIINVYNVFQHFYPYFDVVEVDWERELEEALQQSYLDSSEKDHLITLQKFTAPLKDGHIRVSHKSMETYVPPIAWDWIEDKLVITAVHENIPHLAVGDVVLQVNGQSPERFFKEANSRISAGTKGWLNHRAKTESLYGPKDSKFIIRVRDRDIELTRVSNIYHRGRNPLEKGHYRAINDKVFYLNMDAVPMDTINKLMPKLEKYNSIICDLRGYPKGGNHLFIAHLLKSKDTTKGWMKVPQIIYPNQKNMIGMEEHGWMMKPAKPYLGDKQIIFITDGSAISYAESYMGYIKGYGLATIVGQPTAGANGNVNPFTLPGGYRLSWTGMKVVKHDGSQHHAIGVLPDIYMERTIAGVKAGKDEFLEKAIALTKENGH